MKKTYIIGAGLSGLFAAYLIKSYSATDVVILEQGESFESRVENLSRSLVCGVGGAGTLFGGKFCFPPASAAIWKKTRYTHALFEKFKERCIAPFLPQGLLPPQVEQVHLPDSKIKESFFNTQLVLKNDMHSFVLKLIRHILASGVDIRDKSRLEHFTLTTDGTYELVYSDKSGKHVEHANTVVFATGRSSFNAVHEWFGRFGIVKRQPPDLGIRLTLNSNIHPMFDIGHDRKLKMKFGNIGVRTFCVCSGGDTVIVQNQHLKYYDGHFLEQLTDHVNFGILARNNSPIEDHILDVFCNVLGQYINSDISLKDFFNLAPCIMKTEPKVAPILDSICKFINALEANEIINGNPSEIPVYLPSVDRLNPQISVDEHFETPLPNVYVIGDSTGISRGFIQSMWSAYCAAEHIGSKSKTYLFAAKIQRVA